MSSRRRAAPRPTRWFAARAAFAQSTAERGRAGGNLPPHLQFFRRGPGGRGLRQPREAGDGDFLLQAARRNFSVEGLDYSPYSCAKAQAKLGATARILCGEISAVADRRESYELCVACDVIEHVRQPAAFLQAVHALLRPGGWVFLVTPDLDSLTAKLMGPRWLEFKAEHMYYYTPRTLRRQLAQAGFTDIRLLGGIKRLSVDYVTRHFITYPVAGLTPALRLLRALLPAAWSQHPWLVRAGGMIALARKPGPAGG